LPFAGSFSGVVGFVLLYSVYIKVKVNWSMLSKSVCCVDIYSDV
jgi:hypothetical protein